MKEKGRVSKRIARVVVMVGVGCVGRTETAEDLMKQQGNPAL